MTTTHTIHLSTPESIIGSVPFLLGFAPQESLVLITLVERQVALTARIDINDIYDQAVVDSVTEAIRRAGATHLLILAFSDDEDTGELASLRALGVLTDDAIPQERIVVTGHRWTCMHGESGAVGSEEERVAALEFAAVDAAYLPSRDDLVAQVQEDPGCKGLMLDVLTGVTLGPPPPEGQVLAAIAGVLGWRGDDLTVGDAALAATMAMHPLYRDVMYFVVSDAIIDDPTLLANSLALRYTGIKAGDLDYDGRPTFTGQRRILDRLRQWVRTLPDEAGQPTMAALTVAAVAHYYAGDGATTGLLIERALGMDCEPVPILLSLAEAIRHGIKAPR